jgi:type II secretory pathway component PulK
MIEMNVHRLKNNQGVALIIVLLVTALLIALVFEFAYGTRVSLRAAVNFRDSQRTYFLARSGVNYFIKNSAYVRENLPPGKWELVPMISGGDTELLMRWEDEAGKIRISDVGTNTSRKKIIENLFGIRGVSLEVLDRLADPSAGASKLSFLSGLHEFMSDEDYEKIKDFVTVSAVDSININTASSEVLQSLGISSGAAGLIIEERSKDHIAANNISQYPGVSGVMVPGLNISASSFLTDSGAIFKVYSLATVGGYTKQIVAITGGSPSYWSAL